MRNVEDYAKRVAEMEVRKNNEKFVINLDKEGFSIEEIAETADVSLDFVKEALAK